MGILGAGNIDQPEVLSQKRNYESAVCACKARHNASPSFTSAH